MSFKRPDPFDKRRDEQAITRRMAEVKTQVKDLLDAGWEVYAADEVRLEHEAETRRMWLPKGQRTKPSVDRQKTPQSFFGALSLTSKKVKLYPIKGNQNTEQIIGALDRLQRETREEKIAVVPGGARFHHAKTLTGLHEPGRLLERITPIHLPPYAPDHNPVEHVWNTAKNNIANIQRETPEETFGAFASYITGRTFDHDFEHLPPRETETILFHDRHRQRRSSTCGGIPPVWFSANIAALSAMLLSSSSLHPTRRPTMFGEMLFSLDESIGLSIFQWSGWSCSSFFNCFSAWIAYRSTCTNCYNSVALFIAPVNNCRLGVAISSCNDFIRICCHPFA